MPDDNQQPFQSDAEMEEWFEQGHLHHSVSPAAPELTGQFGVDLVIEVGSDLHAQRSETGNTTAPVALELVA